MNEADVTAWRASIEGSRGIRASISDAHHSISGSLPYRTLQRFSAAFFYRYRCGRDDPYASIHLVCLIYLHDAQCRPLWRRRHRRGLVAEAGRRGLPSEAELHCHHRQLYFRIIAAMQLRSASRASAPFQPCMAAAAAAAIPPPSSAPTCRGHDLHGSHGLSVRRLSSLWGGAAGQGLLLNGCRLGQQRRRRHRQLLRRWRHQQLPRQRR